MKKLLYSLMMVAIALTGCTTWDEPVTENYGDGPSISIDVTATTDSTFTFTITPGAGTLYYSYVIDDNDEAIELDASTLLKGGYASVHQEVLNTSTNATYTFDMRDAKGEPLGEPNTTYQIYAVAASDKGIVGAVQVVSVTTTDVNAPKPVTFTSSSANKAVAVTFNQSLLRGEGQVTGIYYKENDFGNPVELTEDDIDVTISGETAIFTAEDVPAGAYLLFSWETGAFVDAVGNECGAFKSYVNETAESEEDIFVGVWVHVDNESWSITEDYFTAPKAGGTFPKWDEFEGEITFEEKVYVFEDDLKNGAFTITYTNESRTVTYKLPLEKIDFGLDEDNATQKVTFTLPQATLPGDKVTIAINEDVFFDVYGNGNEAYNSVDDGIYWISFAMTKEDVLGTFTYFMTYEGKDYNCGNFTIEEYTGEDAEEGDVVIKDLYIEDSECYGYYVIDECKLYVWRYQPLGLLYDEEEGDYGVLTYSQSGNNLIAFDVNANGTLTSSDFALAGAAPDYSELWWYETLGITTFVKSTSTEALSRAAAVRSTKTVKQKFSSKKKIQLFRK